MRLGRKKTKSWIAGHQKCGICHPKTKAGRQFENRTWKKEVRELAASNLER